MAERDCTNVHDVASQCGLTILSAAPLCRDAKAVPASEPRRHLVEANVSFALHIPTDTARSACLIAPVLAAVRQWLEKQISLCSGIDFPVDVRRGVHGSGALLLRAAPDQVCLRAPVACIVAAKHAHSTLGSPPCSAERRAARLFHARQRHAVHAMLGRVTTDSHGTCLTLQGNQVRIDCDAYLISQVAKILGIVVQALQQSAPAVAAQTPVAAASHGAP